MNNEDLPEDSYIVIQSFMVNELKLKNNELLVYAVIFGFSQDGKSEFTGSLSYLCKWTGGSSKQGIINSLKSLINKKFISKKEFWRNNTKICNYKIISLDTLRNNLKNSEPINGNLPEESYIVIQSFMVNELKLKNNELLVYAVIFGFSQDGKSEFTGSLSYLCKWTGGSSKQGIINSLKSLINKNFISKKEFWHNNAKICNYKIIPLDILRNNLKNGEDFGRNGGYSKKFNTGQKSLIPIQISLIPIQKSLMGGIQKSLIPIQISLTHNIDNNLDIDNIDNKIEDSNIVQNELNIKLSEEQQKLYFFQWWEIYPRKEHKLDAKKSFLGKITTEELFKKCMDSTREHIKCDQWQLKSFIPLGNNFLDGEYFDDEFTDKTFEEIEVSNYPWWEEDPII